MDPVRIAGLLRVSAKSVYQWRRAWRAGGDDALALKGPGGSACKLGEDQLARLSAALDAGPAACGWDRDQRWTLARVAALIARLSGVPYTLWGVSYLLHRLGFTPQVAAHRAAERDEDAIAAWRSQEYLPGHNRRRFDAHLRFVTGEVVPWAGEQFGPIGGPWIAAGFSSGAGWAIVAAQRLPDVFGTVAGFSAGVVPQRISGEARSARIRHNLAAGTLEPGFRRATGQ
jgi:transposase